MSINIILSDIQQSIIRIADISHMKKRFLLEIIMLVLLMFFYSNSYAATPASGDLGSVIDLFKSSSTGFYAKLQGVAISLMFKLFAIELAWAGIKWVLERKPFEELLSHFVSTCFPVLFFYLIIVKGSEWFPLIINSFVSFGSSASGVDANSMNPGDIFEQGVQLQNLMVQNFYESTGANSSAIAAIKTFFPALLLMVVSVLIILAYALMAATVFLVWVEAFLIIAISPILLAFAGMRWTRDMAPKTFNSMVSAGVKILVLMLLMSIFIQLAPIWAKEAGQWTMTDWGPYWRIVFSALACGFLAWKAPQIAANALSGTSSLTAGDAIQMAAMAGAAAVGAGMVATGLADKGVNAGLDALSKGSSELPNAGRSLGEAFNPGANTLRPITSGIDSEQASKNVPDPTGPSPSSDAAPSGQENDKTPTSMSGQPNAASTTQSSSPSSLSSGSKEKSASTPSNSQNTSSQAQSSGHSTNTTAPTESVSSSAPGGYSYSGKPVSDTATPSSSSPASSPSSQAATDQNRPESTTDTNAGALGDASNASLSPEAGSNDMESMFNDLKETLSSPPPTFGERVKEGFHGIQEATPNDQATVGGDAVKLKE